MRTRVTAGSRPTHSTCSGACRSHKKKSDSFNSVWSRPSWPSTWFVNMSGDIASSQMPLLHENRKSPLVVVVVIVLMMLLYRFISVKAKVYFPIVYKQNIDFYLVRLGLNTFTGL